MLVNFIDRCYHHSPTYITIDDKNSALRFNALLYHTTVLKNISFNRNYYKLQVIRHYHGHLSACYTIDLHPTIDVLVTGGRDASARVSDGRLSRLKYFLLGVNLLGNKLSYTL